MNTRNRQQGMTLVVGLIMLAVLTLMVVSAIRFGNINLRIAGNAQTEAEAFSATMTELESLVTAAKGSANLSNISTKTVSVDTGGDKYSVKVESPVCVLSTNVQSNNLNPNDPNDARCFSGSDPGEVLFTAGGAMSSKPTACKDQQWDMTASTGSTSPVVMLQGIAIRVGAEVQCP